MSNITYTIEESQSKFTSTVKVFGTAIKFLINGRSYSKTEKMTKAYIKTVKVIKNTAKGMQGHFFVKDMDGEFMYFSNKLNGI